MKRPLRRFAFSLAKNLGKTLTEIEDMDSGEFMEWVAFEMTTDRKFCDKIEQEIALEKSSARSAEQRSADIKQLFQAIGS